jgi:hypothetical protein
MPNIPEVKFYSPVTVPSLTEAGYDVINLAELEAKNYLTQNQTIAISGDATGSGTTSIALTLANTGVTPGTYNTVTVDSKGLVTHGSITSVGMPVYTVTQNYVADVAGGIIFANGSVTITIPVAGLVSPGTSFTIKRISDAGPVTVVVSSNGTIDGYSSVLIDIKYVTISIISDGNNWWLV